MRKNLIQLKKYDRFVVKKTFLVYDILKNAPNSRTNFNFRRLINYLQGMRRRWGMRGMYGGYGMG